MVTRGNAWMRPNFTPPNTLSNTTSTLRRLQSCKSDLWILSISRTLKRIDGLRDVQTEHSNKLTTIQDQINMLTAKFDSFTNQPQPFGHSGQKKGVLWSSSRGGAYLKGKNSFYSYIMVFIYSFYGFSQHLFQYSIVFSTLVFKYSVLKYLHIMCYGCLDVLSI